MSLDLVNCPLGGKITLVENYRFKFLTVTEFSSFSFLANRLGMAHFKHFEISFLLFLKGITDLRVV